MSKHLLVTYSWSFGNIGDIGITPGLLNLFRKQLPKIPVQIITSQDSVHKQFTAAKSYYESHYPDCSVHANPFVGALRSPAGAWARLVQRWGSVKVDQFEKGCLPAEEAAALAADIVDRLPLEIFEEIKRDLPDTCAAFNNAGFVLYNSGTTLNFGRLGNKNLYRALSMAMPLLMARALGVPYGINSQSFDAIDWPVDLIYRPLFADARFVYCRDTDSLNYLQQRGLSHKHSGFRPDSTFFFKIFDDAWADQYLTDHGLTDKGFLSVIIRIADKKEHDPTIGGSVSEQRTIDQMQKLKQFIESWISETGMKVLICHETRSTLETAKSYLWDILSEQARLNCVYMDHFWLPEQAYSILKRTRILVSQEMHSVIMAINAGTPIIHNPFAEAGRKRQMIRDMGLADWLVDMDEVSPDEMLNIALSIHRDYSTAEQRIKELLPGLEIRAKATVNEIWTQWRA